MENLRITKRNYNESDDIGNENKTKYNTNTLTMDNSVFGKWI